jgi:AcrR family transcriptional regulator
MGIAKEAGVANGSLFTYFEAKADLFNQLYLELKAEMASATLKNHPVSGEPYEWPARSFVPVRLLV